MPVTRQALLLPLLLSACNDGQVARNATAGERLEAAAMRADLVPDATKLSPIGAWARDTDHVCIIPGNGNGFRIGVRIDYGEGQSCTARGMATPAGNRLRVVFDQCLLDARFDGDRLTFPAEVPEECASLCTGRASLAALSVDHLSNSLSEAVTLRATNGKPLCIG